MVRTLLFLFCVAVFQPSLHQLFFYKRMLYKQSRMYFYSFDVNTSKNRKQKTNANM